MIGHVPSLPAWDWGSEAPATYDCGMPSEETAAPTERWLPSRGVLLHVGPPKTGTTALQTSLRAARDVLETQGIRYPVRGRMSQHGRAAGALLGRRMAGSTDVEPESSWRRVTRQVARRPDRAVVSSELFADLTEDHIPRAVAELGGDDVHVLVTLRPLESLLASVWQQDLKGGRSSDFDTWLADRLGPEQTGQFWLRHAHDRLVDRWITAVGPERVCVLVVDSTQPERLLRDSEAVIGIEAGTLQPQLGNRSLSSQEAAMLRVFDDRLAKDLDVEQYQRWVRLGGFRSLVENRQISAEETRIVTPAWARRRARQLHRPMVDRALASGAHVVGEPTVLFPSGEIDDDEDTGQSEPTMVPVDAAVEFALGLLRAARADLDRERSESDQVRPDPPHGSADRSQRRRRLPTPFKR